MPDVVGTVKNDLTWLQKHERLLVWTMIVVLAGFLGNKWIDNSAIKAQVNAAVVQKQLDDQKAQVAKIASDNAQMAAQYQTMVQSLTQQNAALAAAVTQRSTILAKQQTVNATLPTPDLAKRWADLTSLSPAEFTATDSGISVSDTAAVTTVNLLEEVPVLQADLKDTQQAVETQKETLNKANDVIDGQNKQIVGLNQELVDEQNSHKADVKALKAEARKSKRNWFVAGFIAGIGTRLLGHF